MADPRIVVAAAVYVEGNQYLGEGEITLPNIQDMSEDFRGSGMLGALPRRTGLEPLEFTAAFNSYNADVLKQVGDPNVLAKNYRVTWSMRQFDGSVTYASAEIGGGATQVERGAFNAEGNVPQTTLTVRCTTYKEVVDGETVYDIDVQNGKYEVDGTDHWAPILEGL